ncbi:MAG: Bug family tripartite tricarboxylate transporter substrate binding protein [Burkholderiales bacterium]
MRRNALVRACACALMLLASHAWAAESQKVFQRPLRIIVPFAPGGGQDTTARLLASRLTDNVGQQVIVDNRPGAAGIIAGETLLKAPADGHTMYLASTSFVVTPSLRKSLPYDTLKDFAPVTRISSAPGTLVVHASLPVTTVRDLVRLAKAKPGEITFGSAGVASNSHLSGELFKVLAGVDLVHVPYKGSAPASTALVGGEVVMGFSNAIATLPHVRAGRLKVLGVTTPKRSPFLPDVPTIAEAGVPGFENTIWSGVVVNSATPKTSQTALHDAIARVLQAPDLRERLAQDGSVPFVGDTPAEYAQFIRAEIEKWRKVVQRAGIKPE